MKFIVLLYLEEDDVCVARLLAEHGVVAYSRLPLEGHGEGGPGWYGSAAPYASRMAFTVVPEERADDILRAVETCEGLADPNHPIHAVQLGVEASTTTRS